MAQSATERTQRKREKARAQGLCGVCAIRKPARGRKICATCADAAAMRIARRRKEHKDHRRHALEIARFEEAGDAAMRRRSHLEAATEYEKVLTPRRVTPEDECRICHKIGWALFYGVRPERARSFFERALRFC